MVSTSKSLLGNLEDRRLVAPVIGGWVLSSPRSLARLVGKEGEDGSFVVGMTVREKSGTDFYTFTMHDKIISKYLKKEALSLVRRFNHAPLRLEFANGDDRVVIDWNGEILVNPNNVLTEIDAMDRYSAIRDILALRFLQVNLDTLRHAGFGEGLVDLYMALTWSSIGLDHMMTKASKAVVG